MSLKSEFVSNLIGSARKCSSGSGAARNARENGLCRFATWLWENNFQVQSVSGIKTKHIQMYASHLEEVGLGKRTIMNNMAWIRSALRGARKGDLADLVSNAVLGLAGASRAGKKRPISDEEFTAACDMAKQLNEWGVYWVLQLEKEIGLRAEESLQSIKSLQTWVRFLERGRVPTVIFGTKGGRERDPIVLNREKAIEVIRGALGFADGNGGKLISGSLKQAMKHYHRITEKIGLVGEISPHSLRYRYAGELHDFLIADGYSEQETWAMIALSLGHSDKRGRWAKSVYMSRPQISDGGEGSSGPGA